MIYLAVLALAAGFGLPIAILGAAKAQGNVISEGLEGMSRQPEAAGVIQTAMLIGLAFIELFILLAFVITFLLQSKLPLLTPAQVLEVAASERDIVAPASNSNLTTGTSEMDTTGTETAH